MKKKTFMKFNILSYIFILISYLRCIKIDKILLDISK